MNTTTTLNNRGLNTGADKIAKFKAKRDEKKQNKEASLNVFEVKAVIDSFKKMTANDNPTVGPTTNSNTNQLALYFCPTIAMKALIAHFNLTKDEAAAGGVYVGLQRKNASEMEDQKQFCTDGIDVLITMINNDMVEGLIDEMKNCDLTDAENVSKILWDLTVVYRMYQEKIIDSAKKAEFVDIKIALEHYRALSLRTVKHVMQYNDEDDMEISEENAKPINRPNTKIIIYKTLPDTDLGDGTTRLYFRDPVAIIQDNLADFLTDLVEAAYEMDVEMSPEEVTRLLDYKGDGPVADLVRSVKYGYYIFSREYRETISLIDKEEDKDLWLKTREAYNQAVDTLRVLTRQLLNDYDSDTAATIMQLIACSGKDGFDAKSSNQIAINLLPEEFMTSVINHKAEVKVMGYPVLTNVTLANGNKDLVAGKTVEFLNGVSDNGSIIDFGKEIEYATGEFRIENFKSNLYAVQDIVFNVPKTDFSKRVFFVKSGSYGNDLAVLIDGIKEGSRLTIKRDGSIMKMDTMIADVKYEGNGVGIENLFGVYGTVSYLKVAEVEGKSPVVMFELSDIEEMTLVADDVDDIIDDFTSNKTIVNEPEDVIFEDFTTNKEELTEEDYDLYDEEEYDVE